MRTSISRNTRKLVLWYVRGVHTPRMGFRADNRSTPNGRVGGISEGYRYICLKWESSIRRK